MDKEWLVCKRLISEVKPNPLEDDTDEILPF